MTNRLNQDNHSNSRNRQRLLLLVLTRGGIALGGLLLLLIAGGIWWLQSFIQKDLAPLAEKNLTTTINRPVKLGGVTEFSLMGVRFGASEIPATATDPDRVKVEAVEVGFDPIQLILNRNLKLDVTLVNPDVYIEKDEEGRWLTTRINLGGKGGPIKTDLENIRLRNGKLVLLGLSKTPDQQKSPTPQPPNLPVGFSQLNGTAQLLDNNQVMRFDIAAQADSGGNVALKGDTRLKTQAANLQIRGQDLLAADITRIIQLPLTLQAGRVNGDLQIQLIPQQQTLLYGSAFLQGVALQVPRLPQLLNNAQGNLSFQGTEIKLEKIATNYGKIPLVATGIIDRQTGYKLTGQINQVDVTTALETLKVKLPLAATGEVKADIQLIGAPNKPILTGTVATLKSARIDKVDFQNVTSKFEFSTSNSLVSLKDIQGTPTVGGKVTGAGNIKLGKTPQLDFNFTGENVPGDAIAQIYNSTPTFQLGNVSGKGQLTGIAGNIQTVVQWQAPSSTYPATGTVTIAPDRTVFFRDVTANVSGGKVQGSGSYANQRWQAVAQASGVQVESFVDKNKLQNVSLAGAEFNGRLLLFGTTSPFKIASIRTLDAGVQIGGGTVAVSNIQLQDQNFAAQLVANNVRLGRIINNIAPALTGPLAGTFQIAGSRDNFSLKTLRGTGEGSLAVAGGTVTAKNIQLADGVYLAQLKAKNLAVQELAPNIKQFPGSLNGDFNVAGSVDSFKVETIAATGQARVNVADGTITASNIQLANGRYQAAVAAEGVKLKQLNQQLRGQFGGQLQVDGTVQSAKLADVRAAGQVKFSQGIGAIAQPLNAAIAWDGQRLNIEKATATNLNASGYILANAQEAGVPKITALNLNVQAQDYDLQQLPIKLPNAVNLAGKADFAGQVTGNLPVPNIQGQLRLRNLAVKNFAFEPVLSGNIQTVQGQGTNLDVSGNSDRITFNLNANNRPNSFLVKWKEASAVGQTQGENLALRLDNFPLEVLNLSLPANTRLGGTALAGALTGDLLVNQDTLAASGNVAIANPAIGRIKGELLTAQFRYSDRTANITDSAFVKGKSRYAFTGNVSTTTKTPQVQGKLNINEGNVQDILTAIQVFELQDLRGGIKAPTYGTAADLVTVPQGLTNEPLLTQIERLYQVDALLTEQQQQRRDANPVPDLADLQGTFNGEVALDTANGIAAQFNLAGQNWTWGKDGEKDEPGRFYRAEQLIAKGSFENGVLTLLPLRIESKDRLISFKGNVGGNEQSGNLDVKNFPIQVLNNFVKLPIGVTGNLNTSVAVAGSIANPKARGALEVTEGTINQKKVESARASFSYENGRLNFGSNFIVNGPEPVSINGNIPYKLPFASVAPDNDKINLVIQVKNEGLALLNLFTNQVAFDNGQGEVDVQISGTREEPIVNGVATLNNATFSAQALPQKLTEVTGTAKFDFDRIVVENLQGKFSQGKVEAAGEIPIANNEEVTIENPLTVNLNQLALNLKGLYQGNANGNVQITGSALNPILGGKVELFNGQVLLAESSNTNKTEDSDSSQSFIKADKQNKDESRSATTRFNNLELVLGKNVQITRPPILNFQATGTLTVSGSLNQPVPDGKIKLEKGGVNLFTTQFNLARGYEHTATFRKEQPRDPNLDIRLYAKVLDGNLTGDISKLNTTGLSSLETIRVEATVKGPASKLNENLQLSSTPSRGQTELVALLGGGFVDTQGRGDSTLGLINIAGSAVFNNFQGAFNQIGNAFGLSELRLFPTVISDNPEAGKSNSTLELALEAGVDISSKFSISGIKILTANDPLQWGINYRINDSFRLRGSTNLDDDSRAVIEYDRRF